MLERCEGAKVAEMSKPFLWNASSKLGSQRTEQLISHLLMALKSARFATVRVRPHAVNQRRLLPASAIIPAAIKLLITPNTIDLKLSMRGSPV